VEVDGTIHETQRQAEYDAFRDRALADQGIATVRVTNSAISQFRLTSLINAFLKARPPSPPRGEGDRGEERTDRERERTGREKKRERDSTAPETSVLSSFPPR
jgi:hypothetical protein